MALAAFVFVPLAALQLAPRSALAPPPTTATARGLRWSEGTRTAADRHCACAVAVLAGVAALAKGRQGHKVGAQTARAAAAKKKSRPTGGGGCAGEAEKVAGRLGREFQCRV
mmetsp:Transcript_70190/g.178006  ORF Transcript_70190/g.178006 Transcript_70190/m.178006 type:complete len:112 (-) Transcript_70190:216-551(-)